MGRSYGDENPLLNEALQKAQNFSQSMSPRRKFWIAIYVILGIIAIITVKSLIIVVPPDKIIGVQNPLTGHITWYTTPGPKLRAFGTITEYPKSFTLWFSVKPTQGKKEDESLKTRFYDGGHGNISGSMQIDLPLDDEHLNLTRSKFPTTEALEGSLVRTALERSVYFAGPLMSSKESYAEKRGFLIFYIEDQAKHGVYQTTFQDVRAKDVTGVERTLTLAKIVEDKASPGGMARQEISPFETYGIRAYNLNINNIKYDDVVEQQIQNQLAATMAVQTAMARAKEAEQDRLTAEQKGLALTTKAKWEQEQEKVKAVVQAQQEFDVNEIKAKQTLRVAQLDREAAEQTKLKDIALGEGESRKRTLIMAADNQLEKRLEAWLKAQEMYANAISKQRWVPEIQMGASGGDKNAALDLVQLLTVKTAKDLGLDMSMQKKQ